MTSKERWRAAVGRKGADKLPVDYWGTPEMTAKLLRELNLPAEDNLWSALGIDRTHHVWAELVDPHREERNGADVWGVRYRTIDYARGAGSYVEAANHPLAGLETAGEVESYPWPDPDWWRVENVAGMCRERESWPLFGGSFEPFNLYTGMRGLERAIEDMLENPEFLEAALERIFHIHYEIIRNVLEAANGAVDFVYVAEDMGTQESLLFSPRVFRTFLKERMRKIIELAHRHGAFAFHHNDGAIRPLIPELLGIGIDMLNPVQWRCAGMDRGDLFRDFGDRISFHGAMDNQFTLPFGTPEDVRREVRDNVRLLGGNGGYVLAPCHNLQVITPVQNVLAMYDEAHKL